MESMGYDHELNHRNALLDLIGSLWADACLVKEVPIFLTVLFGPLRIRLLFNPTSKNSYTACRLICRIL